MTKTGVRRLIALPLAPHFSEMSIGGYRTALGEALRSLTSPLSIQFVESWHANPQFIQTIAERIQKAFCRFSISDPGRVEVIFSAHSLPKRIQQWGDPYLAELLQSCEAVAHVANLRSWRLSFQSAGRTKDPWLGPDILETLGLGDFGDNTQVLVVPIGFVSDNVEIVFDLDIQAREMARNVGLHLERTEMPNAAPQFIDALADIVLHGTGARVVNWALAGSTP